MHTLFSRVRSAFPFIDTRPVDDNDLHAFCDDRGITLEHSPAIEGGIYVLCPLGEWIFINSRLVGSAYTRVLAHEVAHALLHVPARSLSGCRPFWRDTHAEAETAAALMLVTAKDLIASPNEIDLSLSVDRIRYFAAYGK